MRSERCVIVSATLLVASCAFSFEPYDGGVARAPPSDAAPSPDRADPMDAGLVDSAWLDAQPADAGPPDSGRLDLGPVDSGAPDLGPPDTGVVFDGGSLPDGGVAGFTLVPAGTYVIGTPGDEPGRQDDERMHTVVLTRPYWIAQAELTQSEWRALRADEPWQFAACGPTCPVESVPGLDIPEFLNARSCAEGLQECFWISGFGPMFTGLDCAGYRLPTEAEWEIAARAGSPYQLQSGPLTELTCAPVDPALDDVGWYCGNASGSPHPVRQKTPNGWGLYDVHGNVAEWTLDGYETFSGGITTDPTGSGAAEKVVRGGSWDDDPQGSRLGARASLSQFNSGNGTVGFRLARTVRPDAGVIAATDAGPAPDGGPPGYRFIPAGSFVMGAAGEYGAQTFDAPVHAVTLTRSFWMKATEVTQLEWSRTTGANPSRFAGCSSCPVERVTWDQAVEYTTALSVQEGLQSCYIGQPGDYHLSTLDCAGYRLPTEAEWEYAARAGTHTAFYSGEILPAPGAPCNEDVPNLAAVGWYTRNSTSTHPVAQKPANQWGLFDMHGNVSEWVNDRWDSRYYDITPAVDPLGPASAGQSVTRGGSWFHSAKDCRSAWRTGRDRTVASDSIGLRPVRTAR